MFTDAQVISVCLAVVLVIAPSAWRGRRVSIKLRNIEAGLNETKNDARQTKEIAVSLDKQLNRVPPKTPTIRQHLERIDAKVGAVDRRVAALEKQIGTTE